MIYQISRVLSVCLLVLGLSACQSPVDSGPNADAIVKAYFEDFVKGDVEKLLTYYSDEFYKMYPKETWRTKLQDLFKKYGKAHSYSIATRQADTRFSGKFFIYRYDTRHDNNKRIKHIVTFLRPVDAAGTVVLVGHKISE